MVWSPQLDFLLPIHVHMAYLPSQKIPLFLRTNNYYMINLAYSYKTRAKHDINCLSLARALVNVTIHDCALVGLYCTLMRIVRRLFHTDIHIEVNLLEINMHCPPCHYANRHDYNYDKYWADIKTDYAQVATYLQIIWS